MEESSYVSTNTAVNLHPVLHKLTYEYIRAWIYLNLLCVIIFCVYEKISIHDK